MVVTRRLIGKFGQCGESDAPRAGVIEPRQQIGFAVDGDVRRGRKATGRPTRGRSKYIFGGIGEPAELAVNAWKAILDAHKRVDAWFEPPRALRRGQAQFATRSCVERRRAQVDITFEFTGKSVRSRADCCADYPTPEQLLFCSSILARRIEWD